MRILALKPQGYVLPFIHAFMVKAFQSVGLEVFEAPIPRTGEDISAFLKTYHNRFDAGFIIDMGNHASFIQNFKDIQITLKIPWIIWFVDDPEGYNFPQTCEASWTYAFCWDNEICHRLIMGEDWRGRPIAHLPLAAAPEVFFQEQPKPDLVYPEGVFVGSTAHANPFLKEAATKSEFNKDQKFLWAIYSKDLTQSLHDLVWAYLGAKVGRAPEQVRQDPLGKLWAHACVFKLGTMKRKEIVCRILAKGAIFGDDGWREAGEDHFQGPAKYGVELSWIYNRSSFVLDIRQPQARTGLTQRVFDAGACGVPVLTEWSPELEMLFDPEHELSFFRTIDEGIQRRDDLLQSSQRARKKAQAAKKRILKQHTYKERALQALRALRTDSI